MTWLDLLSTAAPQLPAGTITNETGRVLATLDDWRTILFGALLIITDNILSVAVRDDSGAAILERNRAVAWQA